ncbi:antitoxin [uncultured Corynebacterium sp.]|uniref:antitoxin n=1 Tax=uncultured Corynebacterium sp. TaxID=159447 RepID=UPI0025FEF2C1|nr:AbrB/MazE/SpoVT family DNA-binding domain-containing protein [uncultured Corynebacterium sp.]
MTEAPAARSVETSVFMSGNTQAVRIPKDFRFDSDTVWIKRIGEKLYITPEPLSAMDVINAINAELPEGWPEGLEEPEELPLDDIDSWGDS